MKIREIAETDRTAVVGLLLEGFPSRSRDYWMVAFQKLLLQVAPTGQPRVGLLMEEAGVIVGVLLNIWTPADVLPPGHLRANLSSWYVRPEFRSFAAMLLAKACRSGNVTYLNVSAAAHTITVCEALGFKKYSSGQAVCLPLLSYARKMNRVYRFDTSTAQLSGADTKVMQEHVAMGCVGLVGEVDGTQVPFLFVRRAVRGFIPAYQLVYCRDLRDFEACARGIGWQLLKKGVALTIADCNQNLNALPSHYIPGKTPKYYKGPDAPRPCDLAFTEIPLFGI